jgi:hypothetical protein
VLRIRLAVLATVVVAGLAVGAVVLTGLASAASGGPLGGTWKGYLQTTNERTSFQVTVNRNMKSGTWRTSASCSGPLRLDNISDGYHHYYRVVTRKDAGCAPAGIDCLKRQGGRVLDWFDESHSDISYVGNLRRA